MSCQIRYKGYIPENKCSNIEQVDSDIDSRTFFENYISKRKPVIIKNIAKDNKWKFSSWTFDYLKDKSGNENVFVEKIKEDADTKQFGYKIPKVSMKYSEFLDSLVEGKENIYMTTQEFDGTLDDYGLPDRIITTPLEHIQEDFPISPPLISSLVPHQISLWQGHSKNGSSSGLHHDFHDNLYVLIRGKKRFRLFPPSNINHLHTAGKASVVYENGLIVYNKKDYNKSLETTSDSSDIECVYEKNNEENNKNVTQIDGNRNDKKSETSIVLDSGVGQKDNKAKNELFIDIREDGLPKIVENRVLKNKALREINELERKLVKLENKGKKEEIDALKNQIIKWENILDKTLNYLLLYKDEDEESDFRDDYDDEDDDNEEDLDNVNKYGSDVINLDDDEDEKQEPLLKKTKLDSNDLNNTFSNIEESQNGTNIQESNTEKLISRDNSKSNDLINVSNTDIEIEDLKIPNHFCKVSLPIDSDDIEEIFEKIVEPSKNEEKLILNKNEAGDEIIKEDHSTSLQMLTAHLEAGDSLYLPASWFHEVTSFSTEKDSSVLNQYVDHLALNYWFYPPVFKADNEIEGKKVGSFEEPYCDDFWKNRFEEMIADGRIIEKRNENKYNEVLDSDESNLDSAGDKNDVICIDSSDDAEI